MKTLTFILLLLLIFKVDSNSQGWTIQSSPTTQNLRGVTHTETNLWIAVGDGGIIIRSTDAGITWVSISNPGTDDLRSVVFHLNIATAVGFGGRVIRSTDGGVNWTEESRPTTRSFYSVSGSAVLTTAVGTEGTIFVSYDYVLTWIHREAGTASNLFGISVYGNTAVGVGSSGTDVMTIDGGNGWGFTIFGSQTSVFYGTSFVNNTTGWLVGSTLSGNIIARSSNSGFSWSTQTAPNSEQLFGVCFTTADSGTAVGTNGTIIHTVNGGNTWTNQTSGTNQILNGVSFANSGLGIAVGNAGTILRTVNGGITGIRRNNNSLPSGYSLSQNYPNPFNPSTKIDYQLPKNSYVKLEVFDVLGTKVRELVNSQQVAGNYSVEFDGSTLASGTYFYKIETDNLTETKKMLIIK